MGRRRNVGESRSAGAGRRCTHPLSQLVYQTGDPPKARCKRCGTELLGLEPPRRRRDKAWSPQ